MKNSGSAFPIFGSTCNPYTDTESLECTDNGMTLRDWFAGQVLPSIYQSANGALPPDWMDDMAMEAYRIADAMLAARESKQ